MQMTDLRKAAEMALEALDIFGWHIENCPQFPTWAEPKKHPPCTCGYDTTITALRQALEQPQTPDDLLRQSEREGWRYAKECEAEVKRLRQAIEQAEKPSLWFAIHHDGNVKYTTDSARAKGWKESGSYRVVRDYYTTPPKREWVGLTDEEEEQCSIKAGAMYRRHKYSIRNQSVSPADDYEWHLIRAIEAKLKEKNT